MMLSGIVGIIIIPENTIVVTDNEVSLVNVPHFSLGIFEVLSRVIAALMMRVVCIH